MKTNLQLIFDFYNKGTYGSNGASYVKEMTDFFGLFIHLEI
ncbi:MAG: hypothetical protein R2771_15635 [Saprospiraceae bacterium]